MDRSFAARAPIGRLSRPLPFALPHRATARRLGIALAALALLGGGWLWLRDSPIVAVERVQIAGVQGVDAAGIDAALSAAARRMTTLDVNVPALQAAVAPFRVVRDLSVSTSFPHELHIRVIEQLPVAALTVGGLRTAVAADGVVLGPGLLSASLPAIAASGSPLRSGHVRDATVRGELSVLGAAPPMLLGWVSRVFEGPEGLTVAMRGGLSIYFGDSARPRAKWLSAARVLADPRSAGASYVDVRTPERPAAGSSAGSLRGSATPAQVSATDPTAAALASVLAEAVGGGSAGAPAPGAAGSSAALPSTAPGMAPASASPSTAPAAPSESTAAPTVAAPVGESSTGTTAAGEESQEVSPSTSG